MVGWVRAWLALILAFAFGGAAFAATTIATLSSHPDRVSGGDALVRIDGAGPVTLNGADVSGDFGPGPGGARIGRVSGLKLGANVIASGGAKLTVTNYPISGPITSGPHESPFICTTDNFKIYAGLTKADLPSDETFGPSLDKDCSAKTKITYLYLPKGGAALAVLPDPAHPPTEVATTTTTAGKTVRFVVRVETATIDRGIFQSTVLDDPANDAPVSWRTPPSGWNRKLIAIQGAGCPGGWYMQGTAGGSSSRPGMMDASLFSVQRLGEGYALYGNTLQNASQDCNSVLEGEAAMMGKEHVIKTLGVPDYTVSVGCSGGSYGSSQPADALPGLYDGILIACTFPDPLAIATSGLDAHLLEHFFSVTAKGAFSDDQQVAISGYKGAKAFLDAANQAERTDPVPARADAPGYKSAVWNDVVPISLRYDPKTNPKGARPTVYDHARNVYGVDPATGFARRTFDNVGVQYGLAALNAGQITAAQFLDLNAGVGGYDQDANYVASRSVGDAGALKRAYQSGLELGGNGGLRDIPVFDISGIYNDDGGYHYQWFHFAMRARLEAGSGHRNNYVMWRGNPVPFDKAWAAFIAWEERYHSPSLSYQGDAPPGYIAQSSAPREASWAGFDFARPMWLRDGCWTSPDTFTAEPQTFSREPTTTCNKTFPSYAAPRLIAGGPLAADVLKCRLKPVDPADYKVALKPDELARLRRIFPGGVCDWTKPGVGQVPVVPWASFGPAPSNLVFDVTRGR